MVQNRQSCHAESLQVCIGHSSAQLDLAEPRCRAHAQGFFYNRYTPIGNATGQSTGANKDQQLWYHIVGTPQAQDTFVLALPEQPDWSIGAGVTDDEKCARPHCCCWKPAELVVGELIRRDREWTASRQH